MEKYSSTQKKFLLGGKRLNLNFNFGQGAKELKLSSISREIKREGKGLNLSSNFDSKEKG